MLTTGLTAGRVSGEKKHYVSGLARSRPLMDLRRWPGDGFSGKIPKSEFRPRWKNPDLGWRGLGRLEAPTRAGGAAGRLLCQAGSAAGMWRAMVAAG